MVPGKDNTGKVQVLSWALQNSNVFQNNGLVSAGLPRSGKNIWKMKFFPGQGKVREFCGSSGKFGKDLGSQ